MNGLTTDPNDPDLRVIEPTGQQRTYLVLSEEERAKGFVRPVRRSYRHVGIPGPQFPLRDLTPEKHTLYDHAGYVKFEVYAPDEGQHAIGRFWTQHELDTIGTGCGTVTTMDRALAETYARSPHFYGGTFCVGCGKHLPIGKRGELVWEGTDERVGT